MRNEDQIFDLILSVARRDEIIRAVMLNGSRVNDKIKKDILQDFDVIYFVKSLDTYKSNPNWIDVFGERIILQMPNTMNLYDSGVEFKNEEICYLMLFKDFNRIDLTLTEIGNRFNKHDSLTRILLDKDGLFNTDVNPSDSDYWTKRPSQNEFSNCCNEFWWVSTYVVKALARDEIIHAKDIQENIVRQMFMKIIAWNTASKYNFEINLGKSNRFLKKYIDTTLMSQILNTYSDSSTRNSWDSLVSMSDIFYKKSIELASNLKLNHNLDEAKNVKLYIQKLKMNSKY